MLHNEPETLACEAVPVVIHKERSRFLIMNEQTATFTEILGKSALRQRGERQHAMVMTALAANLTTRQIETGNIA